MDILKWYSNTSSSLVSEREGERERGLHVVYNYSFSAEKEEPIIHIYDGRGENKEMNILNNIHNSTILFMKVWICGWANNYV